MSLTNISERERLAYTINDFGRMMGLGRSTIYNMIARGQLQISQVGHRKLIPHSEAIALLERSRVNPGRSIQAAAADDTIGQHLAPVKADRLWVSIDDR